MRRPCDRDAGGDRHRSSMHWRGSDRRRRRAARWRDSDGGVTARFADATGTEVEQVRASIVVGCDGLHSVLRRQFHPDEGEPRYSGVNMWRGVTRWTPFLSGATMVRAGWFKPAKLVIYPIRNDDRRQVVSSINWVVEIETPRHLLRRDWNKQGRLDDFLPAIADWKFDWLDVPAMVSACRVDLRVSDDRPGSVAALDVRPHDPAGRCGASDGAAWIERRGAVDHRCALPCGMPEAPGPDRRPRCRNTKMSSRAATTRVVLMNRSQPAGRNPARSLAASPKRPADSQGSTTVMRLATSSCRRDRCQSLSARYRAGARDIKRVPLRTRNDFFVTRLCAIIHVDYPHPSRRTHGRDRKTAGRHHRRHPRVSRRAAADPPGHPCASGDGVR